MSDDQKPTAVEPAAILVADASGSPAVTSRKLHVSKKAVVVTLSTVVIVGLIVAGTLLGIRLYYEGKAEELKYQIKANGQSDSITTCSNVVTHHVTTEAVEAWIVQDFNKELQTIKFKQGSVVGCIVTSLNRSAAITPEAVAALAENPTSNTTNTEQLRYQISSAEISDVTFLGKKASALCNNIPTYHAVRACKNEPSMRSDVVKRQKRTVVIRICIIFICFTIVLE